MNEELDIRSLATESGKWEDSDPKAIYVWFQERFNEEDSNQVRRLIRYLKMWAALKLDNPPSSIMITVLASEAYLALSSDEVVGDDLALLNLAKKIKERLQLSSTVSNPIDQDENLNRLSAEEYLLLLEELDSLINTAERARDAETEASAASIWSEAFRHFFPAPADETVASIDDKTLTKVLFVPQVKAVARSKTNSNIAPWTGENQLGPIPRECAIQFTLVNHADLPEGSHVQWVVRNEGEEAEYINDLGHNAGVNLSETVEYSAYNGTHFMDVIVTIPFQGVVGFARIPVQIKGPAVPPRNPKKPGYTRIQRRRR